MNKVYNTQENIAREIKKFLKKETEMTEPQLKIVPYIIMGMVESESIVTMDIVEKLKGKFTEVNPYSTVRRIERFSNNEKFDIYEVYDKIIREVIRIYKTKGKKIYISMDHTFCRDKFVTIMFTLRIGKQGIPLWFRSFKGNHNKEAYNINLIEEGIRYVHELLKGKKKEIVYLGDRWFPIYEIMRYIEEQGDKYCIRMKKNTGIYIANYGDIVGNVGEIEGKEKEEQYYEEVLVLRHRNKINIAVSKKEGHEEVMYVATNGKVEEGIEDYSKRYGSIEAMFKIEKSNGFRIESSNIRNIQAYRTMYGLMNIGKLWMIMIGMRYEKEREKGETEIKLRSHNKRKERIASLFRIGIMYFNICYNARNRPKIEFNIGIYDVI